MNFADVSDDHEDCVNQPAIQDPTQQNPPNEAAHEVSSGSSSSASSVSSLFGPVTVGDHGVLHQGDIINNMFLSQESEQQLALLATREDLSSLLTRIRQLEAFVEKQDSDVSTIKVWRCSAYVLDWLSNAASKYDSASERDSALSEGSVTTILPDTSGHWGSLEAERDKLQADLVRSDAERRHLRERLLHLEHKERKYQRQKTSLRTDLQQAVQKRDKAIAVMWEMATVTQHKVPPRELSVREQMQKFAIHLAPDRATAQEEADENHVCFEAGGQWLVICPK